MSEELLVSVVIPVHDEGPNIEGVLRDVSSHVPGPREVVVVYDRESDDTIPEVRRLRPELPEVQLVRNAHGRGALNALRTGFAAARGRYVLVTMGDRSDDLRDVPAMLRAAERGAVVVAASRYMPGGRQLGGVGLQALLSRLAGFTLHHLGGLPIHDPTSNFKLYARSFIGSVEIESRAGFEVALELSAKAYRRGLALAEVPTTWRGRRAGRSGFALWRWLPHYLRWYVHGMLGRFTDRSKAARLKAS